MLTLTGEQLGGMRPGPAFALVPRFIEQLHALAVIDPAQWTPDALHADTVAQVELALGFGLSSGRDVLGFLTLRHTVGAGFERLSQVKVALKMPSQPEGWRVYRMMQAFSSSYWLAARAHLAR